MKGMPMLWCSGGEGAAQKHKKNAQNVPALSQNVNGVRCQFLEHSGGYCGAALVH
jgi:hypothetical protein